MAKTKIRPKRLTKSTKTRYKSTIKRRRPVHKKILLHPSTIIILIVFGGWLVLSSLKVSAANYLVTATVPAPALTEPAIITSPADQTQFSSQPIMVSGTCPSDSYVIISDNGGFSGVINCASDGTFSIQVGLLSGTNVLNAQDYNITDAAGPISANVTVYFTLPSQVSTTTTQPTTTVKTTTPIKTVPFSNTTQAFVLRSTYHYQIFQVNQQLQIPVAIIGGVQPYGITVSWGDGQLSTLVRSSSGLFQISHVYTKTVGLVNYPVSVQAVDSVGQTAFIQLLTVVRGSAAAAATTTTKSTKNNFLATIKQWLWLFWITWLLLVLVVVSYWLGEREEYKKLKKRSIKQANTFYYRTR